MSNTTFTMRIDSALKKRIQQIADEMDMSSTALVKLVLKSFVVSPKLEIDLTEYGRVDTEFDPPVDAEEFISGLKSEIAGNND